MAEYWLVEVGDIDWCRVGYRQAREAMAAEGATAEAIEAAYPARLLDGDDRAMPDDVGPAVYLPATAAVIASAAYAAPIRVVLAAVEHDAPSPDFVGRRGHGPDERAYETTADILSGRVTRPAREQIRDALGQAEKADAAAQSGVLPKGAYRP